MQITNVKATTHTIPVDIPLLNRKMKRSVTFTLIETDEGITGYGLTGAPQRFGIKEFINKEIAPFLKGKNPLETERIWHNLYTGFNPRSQTGVWSAAVSTIDIALWDIKGKKYREPVWRLLGGAQNPVPCYITFGFREFSLEQLVEMAKIFVKQGEDKLKMVVAVEEGENPLEDARRVKAVRDAIGDKVDLMIDGNYRFSFNRALELCKLIEPYRITWFEEPVYGNDARLLADLRRRTSIPISAGQAEGHRFRHRELIVHQAVDILQPNVCYVGGYTEGLKVAAMAQAFNLLIANGGGWPHHNMHLFAAVPNGWRVEFHYLMWKVGEIIYHNPPGPARGWTTLKEEPGLGLEPRWESLREYEDQ
ncbi:MAG: mandelate racemase/muconate lactonizing enzyme family protein [Deltaproteobacteria bacterium]|nr:mandelate racemase/muconate lactonizing enzyme family protein [Deltaproteobacteria bacterium]